MTIRLVIFDLDGVLVELKESHYLCLNSALKEEFGDEMCINLDDHYKIYDGLPTRDKLKLLTRYKNLDEKLYGNINKSKQQHTLKYIFENIKPLPHIGSLLQKLKEDDYKICVATNSVANTAYSVLVKMELLHLVDKVFSNEDVKFSKPNPEIYFKSISHFGLTPKECAIVEDSPYGLEAAFESGANVIKVKNTNELTIDTVYKNIIKFNRKKTAMKWNGKNFNVLIPMAGLGSRFQKAGYSMPKPLIDVSGVPMIEKVVNNLNIDANFIFVVQREHEKYKVSETLNRIAPGCKIVYVDSITEGAACTTLLAKEHIDNNDPLLLANSDQFIDWDSGRFYYQMADQQELDGSIITFNASHPKWSYAKLGADGYVNEVAEKNPISDMATVGIYYWNKGSDYVKYAEQMIAKNIRTNGEFYVAPVFNEAIGAGKLFKTYSIEKMWGLGTPEDLSHYLEHNQL